MKKKILILSILFFLLDRISKIIVSNTIVIYMKKYIINNFFYLTYLKNDGAAWSILKGKTFLLIIISLIAIIYLIKIIFSEKSINYLLFISYSLLIAGIIGNLFDRIVYGYVIDFIGVKIFNYYFPVFNIADAMIVIGVLLIVFYEFRGGKNESSSK